MKIRRKENVSSPSAKNQRNTAGELESNVQQLQRKYIPVDVIEAILSKLPVKSLTRFKLLSKSYKATISSPWFAKTNYIHLSNRHDLFVQARTAMCSCFGIKRTQFSLLRSEGETFRTEAEFGLPFGDAIPVCSCNGTVLVLPVGNCRSFVLWNPSIRRFAFISIPLKSERIWLAFGLYHDSTTDDLKVALYSMNYHGIFSCKSRTWVEEEHVPCTLSNLMNGVLVDGCFYWQSRGGIFRHDLREGKIEKLKQPGKSSERFRLTTLRGRLCLYPDEFDPKARIWVRENEGWGEVEKRGVHLCHGGTVVLSDESYRLRTWLDKLIGQEGSSFVIYNDCEKRYEERMEIFGLSCDGLLSYSESLFFPFEFGEELIEIQ